MSMLNPGLVQLTQMKDSRWLTLEVCREYQRSKCTRTETECKFAHPPAHVEVQNGRVVCCYDSIKGKCQRKDPPCKYLHPPQHLREQLLQNGRNNLIIKNIQMQMLSQSLAAASGQLIPIAGPLIGGSMAAPGAGGSFPSFLGSSGMPILAAEQLLPQSQPPLPPATNGSGGQNHGQMKMDSREGLQPYAVPSKRPTVQDGKAGLPLYQQTFQPLTAFQVPSGPAGAYIPTSFAGHVAAVPRY